MPNDESVAPTTAPTSIWLKELPYAVVLVLTLLGVAYTSFTRRPTTGYWEFLVPVMGVVCIWSGWRYAHDKKAQLRLIWTQAVHWLAFFAAMNLLLLPSVQRMLNADATGLAILLLLALGTFVAGIHIPALEVCILGFVMSRLRGRRGSSQFAEICVHLSPPGCFTASFPFSGAFGQAKGGLSGLLPAIGMKKVGALWQTRGGFEPFRGTARPMLRM